MPSPIASLSKIGFSSPTPMEEEIQSLNKYEATTTHSKNVPTTSPDQEPQEDTQETNLPTQEPTQEEEKEKEDEIHNEEGLRSKSSLSST